MGSNWQSIKLGDIIEIKYGKDHKKLTEGIIPCYGSGGIMRYVDKSLYQQESILIPRKGSLNNIYYINEPFWTVDTLFWSKVDLNKADTKFIFYQLKLVDFKSLNEGTAVPSMTVPILNNINIKLPPLQVQKEISKVLSGIDDKIELNQKTNQTLEQMAQTLFKSWFVDFDPVFDNLLAKVNFDLTKLPSDFPEVLLKRAEKRLDQSGQLSAVSDQLKTDKTTDNPLPHPDFPSEFEYNEQLGWIPKGWEVSTTDDEFVVKGGSTPSTKNPDFWEGGDIHWTSPKDLSGNPTKIMIDTSRKITEQGLAKITSGLLPVDTVLMSSRAPVGYLALAKVPVAINQGYIAITDAETLSSEYTIQWLESVMDEIKGISGGTTFAEISKKTFKSIQITIPNKEAVDAYTLLAKANYQRITATVQEINSLTKLRDTLLPKLISGEIQIPDIEVVNQ